MLISDNSPVRKIISILTLYRMKMQVYCDVYKWAILKRTSPSKREMCMSRVSNVIYHKLSHGAAFDTLNGKNVNVMLEFILNALFRYIYWKSLQQNFNGSNADGSFTTAVSNSFLSPLEKT